MVKLSVQLYSIAAEMEKDAVGSMQKLLDIGFRNMEPANGGGDKDPGIGYNVSTETVNKLFAPYGAKISSAHMGPLSMATIPAIADYYEAVGCASIVEAIEFYTGYDMLMKRCEEYNAIGKYLVGRGMNPLRYHNHYHEYQIMKGKPILYHILENTDPAYLQLEIDTGWVKRAGRDPIAEMKYAGERVRLIHIKDFSETPPNLLVGKENECIDWDNFGANHQTGDVMKPENFVEIGTGIMPIQEILDTANALGVEYAVLEQDDSPIDIFDSIRNSFTNLKKFKGIEM